MGLLYILQASRPGSRQALPEMMLDLAWLFWRVVSSYGAYTVRWCQAKWLKSFM